MHAVGKERIPVRASFRQRAGTVFEEWTIGTIAAGRCVRTDPRYKLSGWPGQSYALVDSLRAVARFVPKGVFGTLRLCSGAFRTSDTVFLSP